jgi:hypothetical protein
MRTSFASGRPTDPRASGKNLLWVQAVQKRGFHTAWVIRVVLIACLPHPTSADRPGMSEKCPFNGTRRAWDGLYRQRLEQNFGLLRIERVEAF